MTLRQRVSKRVLDLLVAVPAALLSIPVILLLVLASTFVHRAPGLFVQRRVGQGGRTFPFVKLRTMRTDGRTRTHVTTAADARLTPFGRALRRSKLDELPQLWHVVIGQMSLVGPRPDVPGYADELRGEDRIVLTVRPGITSPATLVFRNEEQLLARVPDPERFNDEVLYPAKTALNYEYIRHYRVGRDLALLWRTATNKSLSPPAWLLQRFPSLTAQMT